MRRMCATAAAVLLLVLPAGGPVSAGKRSGSFELVGHDPLMNRGMNAALAVHNGYAYVGSRTDGLHPNAGVMIVDVREPSSPAVVGQIGPPNEGNVGETSREMRVWRDEDILIVLNLASNCSFIIHNCSPTQLAGQDNFRFYDISGDKAADPELIATYVPSENPHEFYLWVDPKREGRALMFISTPAGNDQLLVTDISNVRAGEFEELGKWRTVIPDPGDNRLHSLSVSNDGRRGYVAYLGGGFLVIDTSDFARGVKDPEVELVTPVQFRPDWGDPGAHSAVKLFGRDVVVVTDEAYGEFFGVIGHGCPWAWTRLIDIGNERRPKVLSEYKLEQNDPSYCESPTTNPPDRQQVSSYSAHNPTVTRNLALITWHSGGLQAVDVRDPRRPRQLAAFVPEPLPVVVTEDPALSLGRDKVVLWSYPIVVDGLIYVVDVRNGLYVLRYTGPLAGEISRLGFLEGNSNQGDALRLERP